MESQALDTLVITGNSTPFLVTTAHAVALKTVGAETGQSSGVTQTQYWDPGIELTRLACQQGIRTLVSNARELFRQGGVGGLIRDTADVAVMPRPQRPTVTEMAA